MENSQNQVNCPTPEELGAYLLDAEGDVRITEHLQNCVSCQKVLEEFRQVDALTEECFRPTPGLAQRIQSACLREAEREDADRIWQTMIESPKHMPGGFRWHRLLSMAAALVVVAGLSALTTAVFLRQQPAAKAMISDAAAPMQAQSFALSPTPVYRTAVPARQSVASEQIATQSNEGFSLADSRRLQLNRSSSDESIADVAMVSSDAKRLPANIGFRQLALLPSEIEHVWIDSGDLSAKDFVQQTRQEHPEILEEVTEPDEYGIVTLRLKAADVSVQELVDVLYQRGKWSLLSANYPQPGQSDEIAFQEQPTNYTLKILTK